MAACNLIQLNREDVIQIVEKFLTNAHSVDLASIVNQYTKSWVSYSPENDSFVWTGGERPNYLATVKDLDELNRKTAIDNS